ncbi:MAG TPA: alpha/beta hydrolase [Galbitalea sp.]|jgi:pimeloyl-ACP methyl ester carboxylesterase|nr:alpha/beta hydrolase [Galbitalea sp.]
MRHAPHRARSRSKLIGLVAAVAGVALALGGCTSQFLPPKITSTPTDEAVAADIAPYYHQVLTWKSCGSGFQCTDATAPLDWSKPSGAKIKLALIRHLATDGHPLGSLLVNPGGPGGSGYDFIKNSLTFAVDKTLENNYDIVGFDPRGVNHSSAVKCYTNPKVLDNFIYDIPKGAIGSDEWITNEEQDNKKFGEDCAKLTGPLLGHVDTESAAKDLDLLRAALGDKKLDYLGYSYGTLLGQTYANLFPKKTGRLVLDGVVDPTVTPFELDEDQAKGFELDLRAFLKKCPSMKGCPFKGTVAQSEASIRGLLNKLDVSPIKNSDGRELGSETMFTAIIFPLYNTANWSYLVDLFNDVDSGSARVAFILADAYNDRNSDGTYEDNETEAFEAINCLDYPSDPNVATMRSQAAQLNAAAPVFGHLMAYGGTGCFDWPYKPTRTAGALHADGSAPIIVIGTTGDPATPYAMAQHVATLLQNGHLITYHGDGHTAYNKDHSAADECVNTAVDNFFVHGTVPKTDPECGAK